MAYTADEIRIIIEETCEEIEGCKLSDSFLSLMSYISLDNLVGWFVDEVCCGDVDDYLPEDKAEAINDWYSKHC